MTPRNATNLLRWSTVCATNHLRFIYGLSPGLDIQFADPAEIDAIKRRFLQLMDFGVRHFTLLFDDLPGEMTGEDRTTFESVAAAQTTVTNIIFSWLKEQFSDGRLLFCPTPYCDRMDRAGLGGLGYLDSVGQQLNQEIDVLWTGPEIISREIPVESIEQLSQRLQRSPIIWDNLHANDYDMRRLYCGPYSGRAPELVQSVRGILVNPNNEFPVNFVPLRTLGAIRQRCHALRTARGLPRSGREIWYVPAMPRCTRRFPPMT